MYAYLEGFSETDDILFCTRCGAEINKHYDNGTGICGKCGFAFGVIEVPAEDMEGEGNGEE